jgi:hypothetical protein
VVGAAVVGAAVVAGVVVAAAVESGAEVGEGAEVPGALASSLLQAAATADTAIAAEPARNMRREMGNIGTVWRTATVGTRSSRVALGCCIGRDCRA